MMFFASSVLVGTKVNFSVLDPNPNGADFPLPKTERKVYVHPTLPFEVDS